MRTEYSGEDKNNLLSEDSVKTLKKTYRVKTYLAKQSPKWAFVRQI